MKYEIVHRILPTLERPINLPEAILLENELAFIGAQSNLLASVQARVAEIRAGVTELQREQLSVNTAEGDLPAQGV